MAREKKTPIQQRTCRLPITELSWNLCLRQFGKRRSTHTNAEKQVNLVQEKFCALIFPQNAANQARDKLRQKFPIKHISVCWELAANARKSFAGKPKSNIIPLPEVFIILYAGCRNVTTLQGGDIGTFHFVTFFLKKVERGYINVNRSNFRLSFYNN